MHQLLSNTAGWSDAPRPFGTTDESARGRTMGAVTDTMILVDPDWVCSYSNVGFAMAAYVAERVARAPFAAQLATGLRLEREPAAPEPPATAEDRRQVLETYRVGTRGRTIEVAEVGGRLEWRGWQRVSLARLVSANRLVVEPPGQAPGTILVLRDEAGRVRYLFSVNHVYVKQR